MFSQEDVNIPHNPFVYMLNDKFYYQGEECFLKTCNYLISMHINSTSGEFVVGPSVKYFSEAWEEQNFVYPNTQEETNDYLRAHFKFLKDKGFNSLRIMGCQVEPRYNNPDVLTTRMWFRDWETTDNPDPAFQSNSVEPRNYEILYDLDSGNGLFYYLTAMQRILDIAEEYGMKIIWVLGRDNGYMYIDNHNDTIIQKRSIITSAGTPTNIEFKSFLEHVSSLFQSNKALFCYDFFNEAETFNEEENIMDSYEMSDVFKSFESTIKGIDQNHYTTIGFVSLRQFFTLGVESFKHCDVFSFHIYEDQSLPFIEQGDIFKRQVFYIRKSVPHPWMIGETGQATIGTLSSEEAQRQYGLQTRLFTEHCKGIGYTWWEFHDTWDNYGLVKRHGSTSVQIGGNPSENFSFEGTPKLILSNENNPFNLVEISGGECELSGSYYNVFDLNIDSPETKTWRGIVVDADDEAISDALVSVSVVMQGELQDYYTFTKSNGEFEITLPTDDGYATIRVSKYGYQGVEKSERPACYKVFTWHCNEALNRFKLIQSNLPETFVPVCNDIIVNNGETKTLDTPSMVENDIIVMNGGVLIVKDTLAFKSNHGLFISPGGKLILEDKAALTAVHEFWNGITMTGGDDMIAELYTSGNVAIAKANMAITSDGNVIIDINDTKFINNRNDILATQNDQLIKIKNASFITTEQAYEAITSYYTHFSNCENVQIVNTHYSDNRTWEPNPVNKTGVSGYQSNILITTTHHDNRTSFKGLKRAIDVHHSEIDIKYVDFTDNMHDINISDIKGNTLIDGCKFVVNDNWPVDEDFYNYFVQLFECEKVQVVDCMFLDNSLQAIEEPKKIGIKAHDVGNLEVKPDNLVHTNRTSFTNLNYGILADKGIFSTCQILVKETDFVCSRSIYLGNYSGFGSAKILNNNIEVKKLAALDTYKLKELGGGTNPNPDPYEPEPDELRPYGIYIDALSNYYQIEGNSITSENEDKENKYGVVFRNNGATMNKLYRNDIFNLENSVQAIGNNRVQIAGSDDGLQILCNKFNSNKTDIYITSCNENSNWGIAGKQGKITQPAGNYFSCWGSNPCDDPVINNDLYDFTYYTRSLSDPNYNARETPGNVGDNNTVHITPIDQFQNDENWCLDNIIDDNNNINPDVLYDDMLSAFTLENSIDIMLDDIVDGGNTGQVISDIIHLDDNSAWITYYDLMFKSPYLSDTVLKDIAKKEVGLTVPMIRDILVANPQSAKKNDIKKLLKERDIQLPDYMIEQIEAGEIQISSKEYFEIQKLEQRGLFEESLFTLANYYYSNKDSLPYAEDSLVSLFKIREEPKYLYILADYYVDELRYEEAKALLSSLPAICDLTDREIDEVQDLISFISFYNNLRKVTKDNIYNLNDFYIEQLKAYANKGGIAGAKANQLLYLNNAIYKFEKVYKPSERMGTRSISIGGEYNESNPVFEIYPNPANDYLTVDYKLAEQKGDINIVIVDINGKPVYTKQLSSLEDIVLINLKDIRPGTYICNLFNGSDCDFAEKFVINK